MKISVIIPVFNAEKYLRDCLESILIQTLQDFEVIMVDDCSTDSSLNIAEIYLEQFGGRLKIVCLEENTGSGAVPRNIGLDISCGEYIFFMDSDDLLIDTALETLYNFAKEYQADVVYTEQGFICSGELMPQNLTEVSWNPPKFISNEPVFESKNIYKRIEKFLQSGFGWTAWTKFLRRDFLIDNKINFPHMKISEDVIWTFKVVCTAERFLRLPTALYIQREAANSMTRKNRSAEQELIFWISPLINGLECLNEFMNSSAVFKREGVFRLRVLNLFAKIQLDHMKDSIKVLPEDKVYEIVMREFSEAGSTQPALISYLLLMTNLYRNELSK